MIPSEEFFNKLDEQIANGIPFVAYRKPSSANENIKALLQTNFENYTTTNLEESGFVFAPFQESVDKFIIPQEFSKELQTRYPATTDHEQLVTKIQYPLGYTNSKARIEHEQLVEKGVNSILKGNLKKVVLSRKEQVSTQLNPLGVFKKLLKKYGNAFVYLWFHPQTGYWLGATPESLLHVKRNKFITMALAGTQTFKNTIDVEWGEKELEEQKLVTDYILENLKASISDNIEHSKPYTVKAGSLLHIRTDIEGILEDTSKDLKSLISALHPTPAVCGLPVKKALQFILKNEAYSREYYTGFLGEINFKEERKRNSNKRNQENQQFSTISKSSNLYVNLRCMKMAGGEAEIFVGGGITKDSQPVDEWIETVNKAETLKSVLIK